MENETIRKCTCTNDLSYSNCAINCERKIAEDNDDKPIHIDMTNKTHIELLAKAIKKYNSTKVGAPKSLEIIIADIEDGYNLDNEVYKVILSAMGQVETALEASHKEQLADNADQIDDLQLQLSECFKIIEAERASHKAEMERLKRFDGIDDHPEHRCQRCTGRNLSCWFADNDEWNKVVGDEFGILCPNCFNELSAIKGIQPTAWRLSREGDSPEVDKLRERIYLLNEQLAKTINPTVEHFVQAIKEAAHERNYFTGIAIMEEDLRTTIIQLLKTK